ncbi:MAG: hypothetical protein QXO59_04225 [Candidatus Jordarchaeales archaeon]
MLRVSLLKCQECDVDAVEYEGYYVCPNCGLVVERHIVSPLFYISSKEHTRGAWVYPETQVGSYIDYKDAFIFRDSKGNMVSPKSQAIYKRLKIKAIQDKMRTLCATHYRAFSALKYVSERLDLPAIVRERAINLYKRAIQQLKVSNHILLMAACLLHAVREQKTHAPVTLIEITEAFKSMGYKVAPKKLLKAAFLIRKVTGVHQTLRRSEEYLPRAINALLGSKSVILKLEEKGMSVEDYRRELISMCMRILAETKKEKGGRRPYIFTAAVIYCADKLLALRRGCSSILTQKLIAQSLGVAEYSLRDHYNAVLKPKYLGNSHLTRTH